MLTFDEYCEKFGAAAWRGYDAYVADYKASVAETTAKAAEVIERPKPMPKVVDDYHGPEFFTAPHVVVDALAGTGKTTTVKQGVQQMFWNSSPSWFKPTDEQRAVIEAMKLERVPGKVAMTSFTTDATDQLAYDAPEGIHTQSTYGMGMSVMKRHGLAESVDRTNFFKQNQLYSDFCGGEWKGEKKAPGFRYDAIELCTKARLALKRQVTYEEIEDLADHYAIDLRAPVSYAVEAVNYMLKKGLEQTDRVDFVDMVWMSCLLGLIRKEFDHLVVDEYQDMGVAQQEVCCRIARRLIAIGDVNQAIYGFIGADCNASQSFETILKRSPKGMMRLPLKETRRCPQSVVKMANEILPTGLKALPEAPEGNVHHGDTRLVQLDDFKPNDMVICPTNAPMAFLLFKLVKAGKKAFVRKSDIVKSMLQYVDDYTKGIEELKTGIARNIDRVMGQRQTRSARVQLDKWMCLEEICRNCTTVDEVSKLINKLFAAENLPGAIRLSSVHRAKGLEADRVFFWEWNLANQYCEKQWEFEQARNLQYVGITRAKRELFLMRGHRA